MHWYLLKKQNTKPNKHTKCRYPTNSINICFSCSVSLSCSSIHYIRMQLSRWYRPSVVCFSMETQSCIIHGIRGHILLRKMIKVTNNKALYVNVLTFTRTGQSHLRLEAGFELDKCPPLAIWNEFSPVFEQMGIKTGDRKTVISK